MTERTTPRMLGGRYEVGEVLGRGGMAEVHRGRDTRLGRQVAIKMLRVDLARDPSFQVRFRREAQSAASLNHPLVVAVYDTGEDIVDGNSLPFIVMEYVEGSTLRDLLVSGRRLLPERALEITAGVLEALDYSHRHGIIHRDIKPANVMLTRSGDVKVMDFGIARSMADTGATMTQTSAVIGTAQYLSPEQARGEMVDARSDVYSAGCLLYELLTGRPPFVGESPVSVAYQHVREEPQPPSTLDPDIPPAADAIALRALTKNKDHRYQTAADMRQDIAKALAGLPVEAPPAAATEVIDPVTTAAAATARTGVVPPPAKPAPRPAAAAAAARRQRRLGGILVAVAVLALLAVAILGSIRFLNETGTAVDVPSLVGKTQAQAQQQIRSAGLQVGDVRSTFSTKTKGEVLSQDPAADTKVDPNTPVNLTVSAGVETRTVPTLVGLSRSEATSALSRANLEQGKITPRDSAEPADRVLAADPSEGRTVPIGTSVALTVASGKNTVPDVRGKSESDARITLQQAGFQVDVTTVDNTNPSRNGDVVGQSPIGGSLRIDSTITLRVAGTASQPSTSPTDTSSGTPSASSSSSASGSSSSTPSETATNNASGTENPSSSPSPSPSPSGTA